MKLCEAYCAAVEAFSRHHDTPFPKGILTIGGDDGWKVRLNTTTEEIGKMRPFSMHVEWNGWPAGIIDPGGGVIAGGDAANEASFIQWAKTANPTSRAT